MDSDYIFLKMIYIDAVIFWMYTLHVLQGASSVVAYETSSRHPSHTQSPEIIWEPEQNDKFH